MSLMHACKQELVLHTEGDRQKRRDRDRETEIEAHTQGGHKIEINLV